MWDKLLGLNSFVFWPAAFMFLVYSIGRAVLFLDWKILLSGIAGFAVFTAIEIALGIMAES